ncbi:hypothetical protein [Sphingobium phenoxybenzoativorans]|uniref:hypothetical protein n=1 Tax=Sphingobium phenoxybenzoativorans TaxID=1592790 RepID=UPI000872F05B|nr:hypothetical protein [Sphingobium phenoxybenzoativorans]
MNYMTSVPAITVGREKNCEQCGSTYRAKRSTSRFCTDTCRQSKRRGVDPRKDEILFKRLSHMGLVGQTGPWKPGKGETVHALLAPATYALDELNARYNRPTAISKTVASMSLKDALLAKREKPQPDMGLGAFLSALDRLSIRAF